MSLTIDCHNGNTGSHRTSASDLYERACSPDLFQGEFALTEDVGRRSSWSPGRALGHSRLAAKNQHRRWPCAIGYIAAGGAKTSRAKASGTAAIRKQPMFRRIFLELSRVFEPAEHKPVLPPASLHERIDLPFGAFDDPSVGDENGLCRRRDCAGMRQARSGRRVWRPREMRHSARSYGERPLRRANVPRS
ncbi:hypothetical protein PUN4_700060 [Paraburkholderia unamae]|nr:hypothetical protein PUN4_700060 [Paraburkholderia unamae]